LRRWPAEHPPRERLQFIQAVLWHVHQEGFALVPLPLETVRHHGFIEHGGHLWELAPWLPGRADYHERPTSKRLRAALGALADFHTAASSFPLPEGRPVCSPGLLQRWKQLQAHQAGGLARLCAAIEPNVWPELAERGGRLIEKFRAAAPRVKLALEKALNEPVPLIPCIRDIWHDHVLFEGDEVSGLIDFGAMRPECVAGDIARLLGSLVRDERQGWSSGLAAYERVRPLSSAERQLVEVFDMTSVLLSGLQWMHWVFVERRQFERRAEILCRVDGVLARLTTLASRCD
jgi:homoserine kinase type II